MDHSTAEIIEALKKLIPGDPKCPLCGHSQWAIQEGTFGFSHSVEIPGAAMHVSRAMPSVALVCTICGNTHFINVAVLFSEGTR
jgi:hypothetical protein